MKSAELQVTFTAITEWQPDEGESALLSRVDAAMHALVQQSPFSGLEGVRFYPGTIRIGSTTTRKGGTG